MKKNIIRKQNDIELRFQVLETHKIFFLEIAYSCFMNFSTYLPKSF
jgi:hypothetical protein